MATFNDRLAHQWKDVANLILGVWLAISPWALAYMAQEVPAWNAFIVGVVVAVAAVAAVVAFHKWEEWGNVVLALWLIISPFLLGYVALSSALWNQIVVGVLVGVLALWAAITTDEGGLAAPG